MGKAKPDVIQGEKSSKEPLPQKLRGRAAQRPYPHQPFEDALEFAAAIQRAAGANSVRRLTLFDEIKKAPESGTSRQLIVVAGKYGLIKGGVQSEQLQLTPDGDVATSPDVSERERVRSRIKLAINTTEAFKVLYEKFAGQKLPSIAILEDAVVDSGLAPQHKKECVEIFVVNLRFVGLLKVLSGAERIMTIDHALDQLATGPSANNIGVQSLNRQAEHPIILHSDAEFDRVCFL